MATKLALFNAALVELGDRPLVDTGEPVEAGRIIVGKYDRVLADCLAAGMWGFAMETATPTSSGATPTLGYDHVYIKPSVWVATEVIATVNTDFVEPVLVSYEDRRFWAADTGAIQVRYVSSDTGQGLELAKWPAKFTRYVELELAFQISERLSQGDRDRIRKDRDEALKIALEKDQFVEPWPTFPTTNSRHRIVHAALIELGDLGKLSVRTVDARRVLYRLYNEVVADCLVAGSWNFATESIQSDADTGVTPNFGFTEVFAKPTDFVRTVAVSADDRFAFPLLDYYDDQNFWSADVTPIYVRYVSNDTGMGLELTRWPPDFRRYVELELAARGCLEITRSAPLAETIEEKRDKARRAALNQDSMNESQPKFAPPGAWTQARGGRSGGDRGNRGSLTG